MEDQIEYKTLKEIDGVKYITLEEHQTVLANALASFTNLQTSLESLRVAAEDILKQS